MSETEAVMFAPAPGARPRRTARQPRFTFWRAIRLLMATLGSWAVAAFAAQVWLYDDFDAFEPEVVAPIALSLAVLASLLVVWAALEWFGVAAIVRKRSSELAGMLAIVASVAAIGVLTLSAMLGAQAQLLAHARSAAREMTFTMQGNASQVRVTGVIGPGFARRLQAMLDQPSGRTTVAIDSPGGLVTEAVRAARIIEARPGLTVIVRRECVSACLMVLLAADTRLADYDAVIGVHSAASIADGDNPRVLVGVGAAQRRYEAYLTRRGMPAELIARAYKAGAGKVVAVPAADAFDQGILTGLVRGDQSITAEQARALTGPRHEVTVNADGS